MWFWTIGTKTQFHELMAQLVIRVFFCFFLGGCENATPQIKRVGIHCEAHDNNALGYTPQTKHPKNTPQHIVTII